MRPQDINHLSAIVQVLLDEKLHLSRSDAVAFLILIREHAHVKGALRDLGHSVAHDERTRGRSFDYFEKFTLNFRRVLIHGGRLRIVTATPIDEVIAEINEVLSRLGIPSGIPADDVAIAQKTALMIADALDGTTYRLRVATVQLSKSRSFSGEYSLSVAIQFNDDIAGVIDAPRDLVINTGWLIDGPFTPLSSVAPPNRSTPTQRAT